MNSKMRWRLQMQYERMMGSPFLEALNENKLKHDYGLVL